MFGFLNINKPSGVTSHYIIAVLRRILGIREIGHAGTLDPLAKGVLPVAVGKATKLIDYLPSDKKYVAGLEFGKKSDTYDIEGKVEVIDAEKLSLRDIEKKLPLFRGTINQIPPLYSAVHYKGKRLYELARNGKIPKDISSRTVTIYKNEIVEFNENLQRLKLEIKCSKGTYIRSIVNDLGAALNTGAIMYELTRVESAGMKIENAITLNEGFEKKDIEQHLINPSLIIPLKSFEVSENEYKIIKNGNKIKNRFNAKNSVLLAYKGLLTAIAVSDEYFVAPKKLLCD